jgi:hypothetical protein
MFVFSENRYLDIHGVWMPLFISGQAFAFGRVVGELRYFWQELFQSGKKGLGNRYIFTYFPK